MKKKRDCSRRFADRKLLQLSQHVLHVESTHCYILGNGVILQNLNLSLPKNRNFYRSTFAASGELLGFT